MKIDDPKRLEEKDQRERNKKARFQVRYEYDKITKEESLAEQDRVEAMKMNKISGSKYAEEIRRGFDIVTNQKMEGNATTFKMDQLNKTGKVTVWNRVLTNSGVTDGVEEQLKELEEEQYYARLKQQGVNAEFRKTEQEKLRALAAEDPLGRKTFFGTRSKRLFRESNNDLK